jgi:hypothetical protein
LNEHGIWKYITPLLISASDTKQCGYEKTGDTVWLLILAGNVPDYPWYGTHIACGQNHDDKRASRLSRRPELERSDIWEAGSLNRKRAEACRARQPLRQNVELILFVSWDEFDQYEVFAIQSSEFG